MGGGFLEKHTPTLAMAALQFIYAGVNLLGKAALSQGMSPLVYLSYRQGIATLSLAPVAYLSQGITLNQGLYFFGLRLGSASMATALSNLVPAVTFLMAAPLGLEKAGLRSSRGIAKIAGTGVCVIGAATMAFLRGPKLLLAGSKTTATSIFQSAGKDWYLGCLFLLGSICCWSIWLILQVFISRTCFHPLPWSAWICFFAFLQSVALTFIFEPDLRAWRLGSTIEIICCIYAGVLGSGVTMFVQSWCISRRGALFSAMFSPFCMVITTILSSLFLHEELHLGSLVSSVVVVAGLYLVLWGKAEEYSTRKEETLQEEEHRVQHSAAADEGRKTGLEEPLLVDGVHHDIEKRAN
ncbi:unnamed protein product [Spirodela intermedia]|uniref:WAT1-related protein n=1 Tax=Spirodela intermedia TaxID=51605 RepID=A0A7I8JJC9_SPIIN|nr:unnamed protein product [Spirodela intermedia]CAA6670276.1 unnamed protein product [Spirodela intermedia]